MKSVRSILIVFGAGLALAAGLAFAQSEGGHAGMHHGRRMGGSEFGMFLHQLNLTDDQKAQVKQIFQTEKPAIKPLKQQEAQAHLAIMKLVTSGKNDQETQAAIASTAQQEAQVHAQMVMEHAKIGSQIYQTILTSDQKAKVADMISKHEQMMQQHLQEKEQGGPTEQQ